MFKKLCVVFLSLCIVAAMVLGVNASYSNVNEQNTVTMCDMDAVEELL